MSEKNETLADVLAEMRNGITPKHRTDHELLTLYADRIEAAAKREMSKRVSKNGAGFGQFGNAAAMREALVAIKRVNDLRPHDAQGNEINDILMDVLAAPPRQCDVGTAEEQYGRFDEFCAKHYEEYGVGKCSKCPFSEPTCKFAWAQMPYEEGGAES